MKAKAKRSKRPAGASVSAPPSTPAPELPASPAPSGGSAAPGVAKDPAKRLDPTPPKPVADVMPGIVASVQRMAENSRLFRAEVETYLRGERVPPTVPCPNSGPAHPLDVDGTCEHSWGIRPEIQPVYHACAKCRALELSQQDLWLHRAGAPKILLKASFDNWQPRLASDHAVLRACRDFAANPKGILVLQGGVGLGKTHLCVAIMRAASRGRLITQSHFLLMLRETYRNDRATNPIELCKGTRLLVLDELGVTAGGRDEFPALYEVLNHRYSESLPTVLTTNVPIGEFDTAFGDRIADRLATAQFCQLKGESWRKPK